MMGILLYVFFLQLDKAIQSNLSESCQNVTWNSAFEDCKLKCCCSANSCEETRKFPEIRNRNIIISRSVHVQRCSKNVFTLQVRCLASREWSYLSPVGQKRKGVRGFWLWNHKIYLILMR